MSSRMGMASVQSPARYAASQAHPDYINHPWYKSQMNLKRKHSADADASTSEDSSSDDAYVSDDIDIAGPISMSASSSLSDGQYPTPPSSAPARAMAGTRRVSSLSSNGSHHAAKRRCVVLEKNFAGMRIDPSAQQPWQPASANVTVTSPDPDSDITNMGASSSFFAQGGNAYSPISQMSSISASSANNSPPVSISYLTPQMESSYERSHPGAAFVTPSTVEEPGSSPEMGRDDILPSTGFGNYRSDSSEAWFEPVKDRIVITDLDALISTDSEDNETTPKAKVKSKKYASSSNAFPENDKDDDDVTVNALMLKYIEKHSLRSLVNSFPPYSSNESDKNKDTMALIPFRPVVPPGMAPPNTTFGTVPLPNVGDDPVLPFSAQNQMQMDSDMDMDANRDMGTMHMGTIPIFQSTPAPTSTGMDVDDPMEVEY